MGLFKKKAPCPHNESISHASTPEEFIRQRIACGCDDCMRVVDQREKMMPGVTARAMGKEAVANENGDLRGQLARVQAENDELRAKLETAESGLADLRGQLDAAPPTDDAGEISFALADTTKAKSKK